ncbi:MAG: hypothetical protein WA952_21205, partial [Lewinella sp.]
MGQHTFDTPVAPAPKAPLAGLGRYLPARSKMQRKLPGVARTLGISLASMAVFLLIWQLSASYLYGVEASARIERTIQEQGPEAGAEMEACIA